MGMPQVPKREHVPDICEVVVSLIEAVAIEELAIAHIINAEGEKLQEVIKRFGQCNISFEDLEKACGGTSAMINNLIMKEWILLSKMNSALSIYETMGSCPKPHHFCNCSETLPCDSELPEHQPLHSCKYCGKTQ